uniref:Uncharacterized protein n=1 Tax=Rhizophora mucronata TaxID=61149 RepID=A0A2P2JAC9_RHIMU
MKSTPPTKWLSYEDKSNKESTEKLESFIGVKINSRR